MFAEDLTRLLQTIQQNTPMITYNKTLMLLPGINLGLIFGILYCFSVWRYSAFTYRNEKEREKSFQSLGIFASKGMIVASVLAFGGCFLIFNPAVEHFALSGHGYTRCPNQMHLNFEWRLDVWVKDPNWCFDKGFQRSFGNESKVTPLHYLKTLEGHKTVAGEKMSQITP